MSVLSPIVFSRTDKFQTIGCFHTLEFFLLMESMSLATNHFERITLYDLTQMMNTFDPVTIDIDILKIDNGYSLEKEFTELIRMNL